jgi:hypothetical protein
VRGVSGGDSGSFDRDSGKCRTTDWGTRHEDDQAGADACGGPAVAGAHVMTGRGVIVAVMGVNHLIVRTP